MNLDLSAPERATTGRPSCVAGEEPAGSCWRGVLCRGPREQMGRKPLWENRLKWPWWCLKAVQPPCMLMDLIGVFLCHLHGPSWGTSSRSSRKNVYGSVHSWPPSAFSKARLPRQTLHLGNRGLGNRAVACGLFFSLSPSVKSLFLPFPLEARCRFGSQIYLLAVWLQECPLLSPNLSLQGHSPDLRRLV